MGKERLATFGEQVVAPNKTVIYRVNFSKEELSKAERERRALIWKLKRRKAFINFCLKWVIFVLSLPVTASLWVLLLSLCKNELLGELLGVLTGLLIFATWVHSYFLLDSIFETDSNFITLKTKKP